MTDRAAVIVIAFNEERRIEACLKALVGQDTSTPFEVIVVDDGSTDATVERARALQGEHPNLRVVTHEVNRGRGAARRTGQDVADSTGATWIGFVDADVEVPPHWLARCVEEMSEASGVSGVALPDGDCAVLWRIGRPTLRTRPGSAEITGNNVLFHREILQRYPFSPSSTLGEDFRLAKRMARDGVTLRTVGDLAVRHHETKSYAKGVSWMWESGVDSSSLLFEFRVVRLPDLAWLSWLVVGVLTLVAAVVGVLGWWWALVAIVAMTLLVDAAFIWSRFAPWPRPARFLLTLVISPPMMVAYLLGRTAGLGRALWRRGRGESEAP